MSETMRVGVRVGALAPPLVEQLAVQGLEAAPPDVAHWQKDLDALNRLRIRGIITQGEADKGARRLVRKIGASVVPRSSAAGDEGGHA